MAVLESPEKSARKTKPNKQQKQQASLTILKLYIYELVLKL